MWCFDLRTNDSVVRTEEYDAYEIEISNIQCFRTKDSIASAKDNIDNYRKRLVARELERRRYTSDAIIFTILVIVMTLLASHSWAEIVLFESNNDTINEKVVQTGDNPIILVLRPLNIIMVAMRVLRANHLQARVTTAITTKAKIKYEFVDFWLPVVHIVQRPQ